MAARFAAGDVRQVMPWPGAIAASAVSRLLRAKTPWLSRQPARMVHRLTVPARWSRLSRICDLPLGGAARSRARQVCRRQIAGVLC